MILDVHPGSGSWLLPIPDPGVEKSPDPGSKSATLSRGLLIMCWFDQPAGKAAAPEVVRCQGAAWEEEDSAWAHLNHPCQGTSSSLYAIPDSRIAQFTTFYTNVGDPDPDPYDFGPPGSGYEPLTNGSGSVTMNNESGSGSFYLQAKMVRKPLIPTLSGLLCDFLS